MASLNMNFCLVEVNFLAKPPQLRSTFLDWGVVSSFWVTVQLSSKNMTSLRLIARKSHHSTRSLRQSLEFREWKCAWAIFSSDVIIICDVYVFPSPLHSTVLLGLFSNYWLRRNFSALGKHLPSYHINIPPINIPKSAFLLHQVQKEQTLPRHR